MIRSSNIGLIYLYALLKCPHINTKYFTQLHWRVKQDDYAWTLFHRSKSQSQKLHLVNECDRPSTDADGKNLHRYINRLRTRMHCVHSEKYNDNKVYLQVKLTML